VIPRVGSGMALWREALFATMSRNARDAADFDGSVTPSAPFCACRRVGCLRCCSVRAPDALIR
ncbi:hypothetical protein, partial [Noviherbaspirillum autotrophicum]|uniref:hypothetical protein n=1 Tax=Noviherbaspirillum autotrophicum TaxID=709839 RepID=UPI0038CD3ABF